MQFLKRMKRKKYSDFEHNWYNYSIHSFKVYKWVQLLSIQLITNTYSHIIGFIHLVREICNQTGTIKQ